MHSSSRSVRPTDEGETRTTNGSRGTAGERLDMVKEASSEGALPLTRSRDTNDLQLENVEEEAR